LSFDGESYGKRYKLEVTAGLCNEEKCKYWDNPCAYRYHKFRSELDFEGI